MSLPVSELDDREKGFVLFIADCVRQGGRHCGFNEVPGYADDPKGVEKMIRLFDGSILSIDSTSSFEMQPSVLGVASAIRNPPKPDYPHAVDIWWRSKRVSVVVKVLFVIVPAIVVPAIVGWVVMVKSIAGWFTDSNITAMPTVVENDEEAITVALNPGAPTRSRSLIVIRDDLGDDWPLIVDRGQVYMVRGMAIFRAPDGTEYGLNGNAYMGGYPETLPIQAKHPDSQMRTPKRDVTPLRELALGWKKLPPK